MTPNRDAQKLATRARILEAALRQFEERGFEATSVRDVAIAAEVAAGTVLTHFKDKLDLLHAAFYDQLEGAVLEALAAGRRGGILTRLCGVARPLFAYYAQRPQLSKILLRESLLAETPWRERFTAQVTRVHVRIAELLKGAQERGELSLEHSVELSGVAFLSFFYFCQIGVLQGAIQQPAALFEKLLKAHLKAPSESVLTVNAVTPAGFGRH